MKIQKNLSSKIFQDIVFSNVSKKILLKYENIPQEVLKKINKMVYDAAMYYLPFDYVNFEIISIEEEVFREVPDTIIDRAFMDLILKVKPQAEKPYTEYEGKLMICDWKTTSSDFDTRWRQRYIESWQWKRYACFNNAALFEFRGVSTKTNWDGESKLSHSCHPLIIAVPEDNEENVDKQIKAIQSAKIALQNFIIWPRNMPEACNKFEACDYINDCANVTMPLVQLTLPEKTSYSSDNTFMLCNEKYRRLKLDENITKAVNYDSASIIGDLFHIGIQEIYKQAKELQENGIEY